MIVNFKSYVFSSHLILFKMFSYTALIHCLFHADGIICVESNISLF